MKITIEELREKKEWLHHELVRSFNYYIIKEARKKREFEVKLLVNGKELEPKFFNDLVNNIEKYVDLTAENLFNEKLEELGGRMNRLDDIVQEAMNKIREEFDIDDYE